LWQVGYLVGIFQRAHPPFTADQAALLFSRLA
jgi:hypothetical protein